MKKIKGPTSWRPRFGQWPSVAVSVTDMDSSDYKVTCQFNFKIMVCFFGEGVQGETRGRGNTDS